jgi:hypothetical protein
MNADMGEQDVEKEEIEVQEPDVSELERLEKELDNLEDVYEHLFEDVPVHVAKMASKKEREDQGLSLPSLTYGEILFRPFVSMLRELYALNLNKEERLHKFVDIGSGCGKAVFAAALGMQVDNCVGIEILEGLAEMSKGVLGHWDDNVKSKAPEHTQSTTFEFIHGDALEIPWQDADVVFINSTCFDEELLDKFSQQCSQMRKGTFVITTTRQLTNKYFQMAKEVMLEQAWGSATCYLHVKYLETADEA